MQIVGIYSSLLTVDSNEMSASKSNAPALNTTGNASGSTMKAMISKSHLHLHKVILRCDFKYSIWYMLIIAIDSIRFADQFIQFLGNRINDIAKGSVSIVNSYRQRDLIFIVLECGSFWIRSKTKTQRKPTRID